MFTPRLTYILAADLSLSFSHGFCLSHSARFSTYLLARFYYPLNFLNCSHHYMRTWIRDKQNNGTGDDNDEAPRKNESMHFAHLAIVAVESLFSFYFVVVVAGWFTDLCMSNNTKKNCPLLSWHSIWRPIALIIIDEIVFCVKTTILS